MPVTAKLSKQFYEKLGDEVANELVTWLNAVDTDYRTELRRLADMHYARFEARLAQLGAELRGEFRTGLAEMRADIGGLRSELTVRLQRQETRLIRWMFAFWIGSWAAIIGTLIGIRPSPGSRVKSRREGRRGAAAAGAWWTTSGTWPASAMWIPRRFGVRSSTCAARRF